MTLQARLDEMLAVAREAERYGAGGYVYRGKANPAVFAALVEVAKAGDFMRTHEGCRDSTREDIGRLREAYAALESALEADDAD